MAAGLNLQPQTVNGWLTLKLSNQGLTSIPEEVFDITDLEYLDVSNNKLSSIPEAIGRLQKLSRLAVSGNMLTSLPQAICSFPNLEVLSAHKNKLSAFPPGVEKLQELRGLFIHDNQLTDLPSGLCSLPNLDWLSVSGNKLSNLPPGVEKLQKLRRLHIADNQLTEFTPGLCLLHNLELLGASNNKLSTFPPGVERLQKLRKLDIADNQLTEFPSGICSLLNLELLSVGNNPIRQIPDDVTRLTRLKSLSVPGCPFDEFPRQVLQLKTLEVLCAGGCGFDIVPDEMRNLQYLQILVLEYNLLKTLPSTLSHLHNLREVNLRSNEFDTFPELLCELPAMEKLEIWNNNITRLPTALHRADKLKDLDVSGNPLTYPPQDVCKQGTGAIMAFLKQEAEKDERILRAFNRLSVRMSQTQWKPLARSLGLSNRAVDAIKASAPDDVPDQVYQTLVQWREKEGEAATLSALEQHLRDLDFQQLADQLSLTHRTPDRRGYETGAVGAVGGQEADGLQNSLSKYPSVTVDQKFPIIHFDQLEVGQQSILGRGGFAYVKKARHLDWKQDVAVKCLFTRQIEGSEQELLYSEARKLKLASNSAHVISLLGVCLDPNFAIVMPYMENGSLAGLLRDVDVPWALRWRMAHEISLGMTFLHCQNPQILHCDLKAENVLLDGDFHVKISDFGLSKWKMKSRVVTQTSPEGSTITHAPPEFFLDINLVPTPMFDVYSFGVLLWEIITRAEPYGSEFRICHFV
ncbi:leucine-rich repeat and IQ domain-containing protein 4-like [Branchiostoma floridae]|uniref:Leucine-rich repeat protein SHOC-2 n=1 Tax=Branchiostoma floridae TaxID=7739 RepID=A0A9J7KIP5_BRAFL|nr:leucine-rich repeat and IQ domain-containing protein 4-like [Branchiostoma floridae]